MDKRMTIAMIGHKYVPSREGGVEVVVDNLSTNMTNLGNEITLFNRRRKKYEKRDHYNGCKVVNVFTIDKKLFDAIIYVFLATIKARNMAKKGKFDVLHFHAEGPCLFLNLLPKKRNYKVVVTIHGLDWQRSKWGKFASRILKKGEERAAKYADEIIVLSNNNHEYFKKTYGRETTFIPNGIDIPQIRKAQSITQKWGLTKDSYVLFMARIVPEKGLHYLIEAWKKVVAEINTDKKLVIAGAASHTNEYHNRIMEMCKGDESIVMTGFVQGQELQELYSNAYLFVLPSDIEGMSMGLLEALSYGNTCLVSDIPENTEVISKNSYSFKKGNVDDLAEKLKEIINKNLQTHTGTTIYHTWQEVTKQTLEVYRK